MKLVTENMYTFSIAVHTVMYKNFLGLTLYIINNKVNKEWDNQGCTCT